MQSQRTGKCVFDRMAIVNFADFAFRSFQIRRLWLD